eukprot:GHVP01048847.1.p1 GENE.GHVP01048847.1~~GHVP01048847.1.p1  ORF type:complete len:114 (+),score=16.39 GHVP01048847.1:29-370(+)
MFEDFISASSPCELIISHPAVFQGMLEEMFRQAKKVVGKEEVEEDREVFRWRNWFYSREEKQIQYDETFDSNHQSFLYFLWRQNYPLAQPKSLQSQDSENPSNLSKDYSLWGN